MRLMRILIIEDEPGIAGFLKEGLEEECFAVDVANNLNDCGGEKERESGERLSLVIDCGVSEKLTFSIHRFQLGR